MNERKSNPKTSNQYAFGDHFASPKTTDTNKKEEETVKNLSEQKMKVETNQTK